MLTVKEWMELVDYRITEGSDYWPEGGLQGRQLYSLSSWNGDHDGWSFNIGFDPKNEQRVYIVEVCDYKRSRAYRLIDNDLKKADKTAWDGVDYVDLEEDDDFIQKALAIKSGEDYDIRVDVPLTVPDDVLFELMKKAHEQDITLNRLVEQILQTAIDDAEDKQFDEWDDICEDHFDDSEEDLIVLDSQYPDGDGYWKEEMTSDLQDFKPAAKMKAKKKK